MIQANVFRLILISLFLSGLYAACKKSSSPTPGNNPGGADTTGSMLDTVYHPVDPPVAATIGFFLDGWKPKTYLAPAQYRDTAAPSGPATATIQVDMNQVITKVSPDVFGNNANTWMGQMVTEPTLLQYITDLSPHIIRAPGGSISDVYFWNQSAAPPPDAPDSLYDSNGHKVAAGYWYGMNTQNWTLSIDHYYQMLQQTHNQGMITVNYAYARYGTGPHPVQTAAHLAADWVRYDHGRTHFWEIGNESNGVWEAGYQIDPSLNQDGQPAIITGQLYAQHVKVFADSMRAAAREIGATIYIGAQLLDAPPASWQTSTDKNWNAGVLTEAGNAVDFFIVHDYFTPYQKNSTAAEIIDSGLSVPARIMGYLNQQFAQYGILPKPIALTEWNIFATGSMQMVSNIAGLQAAIVLGELIKNQFGEASRWDLANGWDNGNDMGLFNMGDEPGAPKWNPRPAFYYMLYFQRYFGDRMVASTVQGSQDIKCYASSFAQGPAAGLVLINTGNTSQTVAVRLNHFAPASRYYWFTFTGGNDNGEFSRKVYINGQGPAGVSGGPATAYNQILPYSATASGGIRVGLPPKSVTFLQIPAR
ncbi:MAG: alpha-L-arabinofuranosidase [Thermoflavifilum sp.]|nr:alpha-L-arabinofuranosidase [Thermoflavifilum sp.]